MSRQIDIDNLDIDGAHYLVQRPHLIEEARFQGVDDIDERIQEVLEAASGDNYEAMTVPQLRELAQARGIEKPGRKKDEIVKALQGFDDAQDGGEKPAEGQGEKPAE